MQPYFVGGAEIAGKQHFIESAWSQKELWTSGSFKRN